MPPGCQKRSLNVTVDLVDKSQNLLGYKTLNLLNSHTDPSFMRTVLYNHIARHYLPAPEANLVRVVINGESWGVYINEEQFNKDFGVKGLHFPPSRATISRPGSTTGTHSSTG